MQWTVLSPYVAVPGFSQTPENEIVGAAVDGAGVGAKASWMRSDLNSAWP